MPSQNVATPAAKRPIDILTRVSEQGRRSDEALHSHDLQDEKVRKYLDVKGLRANTKKWKENNISGGKMSRKVLNEILDRIDAGESGGLAVAYLDRFARTLKEALEVMERIEKAGGVLIALDCDFDTSTAMGKAMMRMALVMAAFQRDQAAEKSADTTAHKIEKGESLGGAPPAGFTRASTGKQDSNRKDILEDNYSPTSQFEAVKEARLGFASGRLEKPGSVADFLNAAGVRTRATKKHPDGKPWNARNVLGFLRNRNYTGTRYYDGKAVGTHEAAHDEPTQRVIERKIAPKNTVTRVRGEGFLLDGGLCRCAKCSDALSKSSAGANVKYPTLRCNQRGVGHSTITMEHAEAWITSVAFVHGVDFEGYVGQLVSLRSRDGLVERIEEAQAEYDKMAQALGMEKLPEGSVQAQALAVAEDALYTHDAQATEDESPAVINRAQFESLESLADRKKALRSIVKEVVILPGVKGKKDQDYGARIVVKFHDGSQHPALPDERTPFTVIEERETAAAVVAV